MSEIVSFYGLPETIKLLSEFEGQPLQNKMRVGVRAGLKPFQRQLIFEADTPGHPHSFTKVPAGKVSTHGGASGHEIEGHVRPSSPLFSIFEEGAGAHTIAPRRGSVLGGPAGEGSWTTTGRKRSGRFFSRRPVRHPGMRARPILAVAFAAAEPAAADAIAAAIFGHSVGTPIGGGG